MSPDLLIGIVIGMLVMFGLDHGIFPQIAHSMTVARHRRFGGR
jgi:hypothetical protein